MRMVECRQGWCIAVVKVPVGQGDGAAVGRMGWLVIMVSGELFGFAENGHGRG